MAESLPCEIQVSELPDGVRYILPRRSVSRRYTILGLILIIVGGGLIGISLIWLGRDWHDLARRQALWHEVVRKQAWPDNRHDQLILLLPIESFIKSIVEDVSCVLGGLFIIGFGPTLVTARSY